VSFIQYFVALSGYREALGFPEPIGQPVPSGENLGHQPSLTLRASYGWQASELPFTSEGCPP
jgi:hypothetical protein